jgi:hypothetical protein
MRISLLFLFAAAAGLVAQTPGKVVEKFEIRHDGVGPMGVESMMGGAIKGQPYSAEVISEMNQALADGNRISHRTTAFVARDSQGRTRHEARVNVIGSVAVQGDLPKIVMIHDPLAQVTYTLDEKNKTARKMSVAPVIASEGRRVFSHSAGEGAVIVQSRAAQQGPVKDVIIHTAPIASTMHWKMREGAANVQSESLGIKSIEGAVAEGKRMTHTIPAADIGADRDIQIVNEVWTAQDLKAVVYSKRSDPRTGEMIYRLANIQRAEPPASLFEVPADYKVIEGLPEKTIMFRSKDD